MTFKYPWILLLLLVNIPLIFYYFKTWKKDYPSISMSSLQVLSGVKSTWKVYLMHACFALKLVALSCIVVALARPQSFDSASNSRVEGTDIVLALDISSSMLANDLQPTRMKAAKDVTSKFISNRVNDNMSLVVFSGESLSLMPLTNDRNALISAVGTIKEGMLEDGTAIGDGITSAINRLTSGKAKSKSIVLLTDGTNNAGDVAPSTAAQIAKQKGIKIYTIGVGTNGRIQIPDPYGLSTTVMETKIDDGALKNIAKITNGKYFRATDSKMLADVFQEIDSLEKTELDVSKIVHAEEEFFPWILIALCAYVAQTAFRYTLLRRLP